MVIAVFLTRVYEFRWVAVSGLYKDTVVVIYRGDGTRDLGRLASAQFSDIGSAGGHKALARAEFSASATGENDLELFIFKRLLASPRKKAHRDVRQADNAAGNAAPAGDNVPPGDVPAVEEDSPA